MYFVDLICRFVLGERIDFIYQSTENPVITVSREERRAKYHLHRTEKQERDPTLGCCITFPVWVCNDGSIVGGFQCDRQIQTRSILGSGKRGRRALFTCRM